MEALLYSSHGDEYSILVVILQQAGVTHRPVKEIETAMDSMLQRPADMVLLAISGDLSRYIQQIRQIRVHTITPILIITDPIPEDQRVILMEAGVDWIVDRPYGVRLLVAQIKSILRRGTGLPFHVLPTLTQSGITLDPASRTATVEGQEARRLTQLEFRLLYTLITHAGQIIPTENLVEYVWGYSGEGNRELVRGLVQRLRSKIEPDQGNPMYILTEPGIGYLLARDTPVPRVTRTNE